MLSLRNCSAENRADQLDQNGCCWKNVQFYLTFPFSPARRPVLPLRAARTSLGTTETGPSPSSVSSTATALPGRRTASTATLGPGSAGQSRPPAVPSGRTTGGPGTASRTSASTSQSPPAPSNRAEQSREIYSTGLVLIGQTPSLLSSHWSGAS